MADYNLAALSLGELTKIQEDVAKAISTHQDWQKAEARALDEALAQNQGYYLAEIVGSKTKTAHSPETARHQHSEHPAPTWSGRRRKPRWFVKVLVVGNIASEAAIR